MGSGAFLLLRRMGALWLMSGENSSRNFFRQERATGPRGHLRSLEPLPMTVATPLAQSIEA